VFGVLIVVAFSLLLIYGPHSAKIQNIMPSPTPSLLARRDKDEADTRERLRTDPNNAELNRHLAEILLDEGHSSLAEQYARRAVGLDPNSSATHYTLASVLREQNKKPESDAEKKAADKLAGKGK
jgi:predicted Zn-dependent protease